MHHLYLHHNQLEISSRDGKEPKILGSSSGSDSLLGGFGSGSGSLFTLKVWVRFGSGS